MKIQGGGYGGLRPMNTPLNKETQLMQTYSIF